MLLEKLLKGANFSINIFNLEESKLYDQSAAHWRQKAGTLRFLFRALREQRLANNNTYSALSHYVHEKGTLTPLNARLHVWCPRRDSNSHVVANGGF